MCHNGGYYADILHIKCNAWCPFLKNSEGVPVHVLLILSVLWWLTFLKNIKTNFIAICKYCFSLDISCSENVLVISLLFPSVHCLCATDLRNWCKLCISRYNLSGFLVYIFSCMAAHALYGMTLYIWHDFGKSEQAILYVLWQPVYLQCFLLPRSFMVWLWWVS